MRKEDERFGKRLIAGDELAIARARAWIRGTLRRYASVVGSEFEDLEQEVMIATLENLRDGKFEGRSSLETFVRAVAHHRSIDLIRVRSRRTFEGVDDLELETQSPSPYDNATRSENVGIALEVLKALPETCRELLRLVYQGYSYQEMAQRYEVAPGTLRVRLLRCRRKAREIRDRRRSAKKV